MYTTSQRRVPCEHDRYQLYEAAGLSRGFVIGWALFCPVCQIFNHATKHTYNIERALRSRLRLLDSLSHMTFIPGDNTTLTTTCCLRMTLREHPAQDITSLLNNLRSQYAHLIHICKLVGDPNTDHPQSPITHALHNLARTLNIPSCQHFTTNPLPTSDQEHARYTRAATICPCPITTLVKPGTPRMYEYCDQLKHILTQSPATACPAYAKPLSATDTPNTCSSCVLYALIQ